MGDVIRKTDEILEELKRIAQWIPTVDNGVHRAQINAAASVQHVLDLHTEMSSKLHGMKESIEELQSVVLNGSNGKETRR